MTYEIEFDEALKGPRVLLVEDQHVLREALSGLLSEEWFEVVGEASDGQEAVELARELRPDVALVDFRLPGMDGAEATRLMKEENPNLGVVMLTAYDDQSISLEAIRLGVDIFLVKGVNPAQIADALLQVWRRRAPQESPR